MVAGANGGEVSGGTTGTLARKDHSLAISGHFLLRQKMGIRKQKVLNCVAEAKSSSNKKKKRFLQTLA